MSPVRVVIRRIGHRTCGKISRCDENKTINILNLRLISDGDEDVILSASARATPILHCTFLFFFPIIFYLELNLTLMLLSDIKLYC